MRPPLNTMAALRGERVPEKPEMPESVDRCLRVVRLDNGRPMRSGIPFDYLDP